MTISRLEASLRDAFDYGQVYVALSRATSVEGLRVTGFDEAKVRPSIRASPRFTRASTTPPSSATTPADPSTVRVENVRVHPHRRVAEDTTTIAERIPWRRRRRRLRRRLSPRTERLSPSREKRRTRRQALASATLVGGRVLFQVRSSGTLGVAVPLRERWAPRTPPHRARGFADGPSAYEGRGGDARSARGRARALNRPVAHAGDWRLGGYTTNDPPSP